MSFGYVNDGSAVMRGPMVTQLLDQFMAVTHWGALDYLILDMPPGTGDIQLTLTQRLNITAAVIVTTPQELSFVDVARGVEMFDSVNVPSVAVVENMAYYEVENKPKLDKEFLKAAFAEKLRDMDVCQNGVTPDQLAAELVHVAEKSTRSVEKEQVRIFGPGHKKRLADQWGIEHCFSVPMLERIAANGDSGTPFILEFPDSPQAKIYKELASTVVSEVAKAKFSRDSNRPSIHFDKEKLQIKVDDAYIAPAELRRACRCAACVEELTGRQILIPSSVSEKVEPLKMNPCGNYALSVDWSDGHRSLYPYRQIRSLLQEKASKKVREEVKI
jgi:MinD-like ATPase involved in chromosome partitioning or flagellar assembly